MRSVRRLLIGTLAGVTLVTVVAAPGVALSPNDSILFYKSGRAVTGVLKGGTFTKKRTFDLSGVNRAAASRDSLALYKRDTGELRTGTFRGGVYTPVETITVRPGFTHAAAGCDSLVLYNAQTGRILVGTFVGGRFRNRSTSFIDPGWEIVAASCTGISFQRDPYADPFPDATASAPSGGTAYHTWGTLAGGDLQVTNGQANQFHVDHLAMTASSWLSLDAVGSGGKWGAVATDGTLLAPTTSPGFATWDIVAGTATSIQFYMASGDACHWTVVDGVASDQVCGQHLAAGWKLIVGGR